MAGSYSKQARECFELHPEMAYDEGLMLCDRSTGLLGFMLYKNNGGLRKMISYGREEAFKILSSNMLIMESEDGDDH